jgi:hypothetical protein
MPFDASQARKRVAKSKAIERVSLKHALAIRRRNKKKRRR